MACATYLILVSFFCFASTFGNAIPEFASPITSFLNERNIATSVHAAARRFPKTPFIGRVVGICVGPGLAAIYTGKFNGSSSRITPISAHFNLSLRGHVSRPHVNVSYSMGISGKYSIPVDRRSDTVIIIDHTKYNGRISGYANKKRVSGTFNGTLVFVSQTYRFEITETVRFRYYYGKNLVTGWITHSVDRGTIKSSVHGKFNGNRFSFKYGKKTKVPLLLGNMDPIGIKRNYGSVYVRVKGKNLVRNFNVKSDSYSGMIPALRF